MHKIVVVYPNLLSYNPAISTILLLLIPNNNIYITRKINS